MHFGYTTLAVATTLLATAAALSPADIPADLPVSSLLTTAQTHLSRGETNEALVYYDAAVARDSSNYLTLFKRGATYLSLGRTNQATDDFNKVLELKPGFEGAHLQLARIRQKTADWEGARAEFTAAGKPADDQEVLELVAAHDASSLLEEAYNGGNWDDCVSHASTAIMIAGRSTHLREMRSKCRFERGELEEAMADLQHILQMRPGDTDPHVTISATTFYGIGDMEAGMAQIRKCLHSDPDSKVCKKVLKKQKAISKGFAKAEGQLKKGQTTTAGRSLVGAEGEPGLISDVKEQIEELRAARSIPAKAKASLYEKVIELTCQAYSESSHKDVNKYCDEALELNPTSFWGLFQRGKTLYRKEDYEAAVRTFKEALEAHPGQQSVAHSHLQKAEVALRRSKTKDYYKILGVAQDADERQIKSAYRKATKLHHPDKAAHQGISKDEAEKKMAGINEAYEVLSDPELRARFDRGDDPMSQEQGGGGGGGGFHQGGNPFHFGRSQFMYQGGGPRMKQGGGSGGGGGGGNPFGNFHFGGGGGFGF